MKSVFNQQDVSELIDRVNSLKPESKPVWGKMNVAQMLAHVNVPYEMVFENKHPIPGRFKKILMKLLVKNSVVGDKPYRQNSPTAPSFLIKADKDFEKEKSRLIQYLLKTHDLGEGYFEGRESHSFGQLSIKEWNNMFYKHLDHHLKQFGV